MSKNSGNTTKDMHQMSPHQTGQVGDQAAGNTGTMTSQASGAETQTGETQAGGGSNKQKNQTHSHEPGQGNRASQTDLSKTTPSGGGDQERGPRGTNV